MLRGKGLLNCAMRFDTLDYLRLILPNLGWELSRLDRLIIWEHSILLTGHVQSSHGDA